MAIKAERSPCAKWHRFGPAILGLTFCLAASSDGAERQTGASASDAEQEKVWKLKQSEKIVQTAKKRHDSIVAELKRLGKDHAWAGDYFFGDGKGVNVSLDLAPEAGFAFEWHGCLGDYDRNYGTVQAEGGLLHLRCELPNFNEGFQGIATNLVPVTWGTRHYLIAVEEMPDFCNAVNAKDEPRSRPWGRFLLRRGDEETPVSGRPELPPKYQAFLLEKPLVAELVAVGPTKLKPSTSMKDVTFRIVPVEVNAGKADGVFEGMKFHVMKPLDSRNALELTTLAKVIKVGAHACTAEFTCMDFTDMDNGRVQPQVGWKLSTLPVWRQKGAEP